MNTRHLPCVNSPDPSSVRSAGVTLIEAVMSMLIVGLMLVAALNTVGASRVTQSRSTEQTLGPMLADELMSEILNQAYEEPDDTPAFGRESGEFSGSRSAWDDIDDYKGWSAGPPEAKDGTSLSGMQGWTREVQVGWASSVNPNLGSLTPTGIKRIEVVVKHNGRPVTKLSALRTNGWPSNLAGDEDEGLLELIPDLLGL